ncbi:ethylene-responsive transcription factor ERF010-like [Triticum urartu]|uniref:ethylene-responsive transcription factor ERF010-like n=1 Tax=Triticum urartu TaxID=4572 RepID=UPI002044AB2A|nr:ethylene-responsive transcription factor ERF010-like [Triticum urartu]
MSPKKTPKGKSGFFGVRQKPSGNWGVEFSDAGRRWWIGTYPSAHEVARAYDVAVWRAERPRSHLKFPEIESRAEAEILVPQGINMKEITMKKKKTKKPSVVVSAGETDEEAMARFAREHPEYVQAEIEYYWKREAEQKKKGSKKEDEAGPSTVIPIESSSEEDWADFSEEDEEDEGCDDPTKEEFWEQFRSSDEE